MSDSISVTERVHELLNTFWWLPGLQAGMRYARTHDDCDGDRSQKLSVVISEDGDAWIAADALDRTLRFRVPLIGGGASPRVRAALVILAEAIRLDNEEHPL